MMDRSKGCLHTGLRYIFYICKKTHKILEWFCRKNVFISQRGNLWLSSPCGIWHKEPRSGPGKVCSTSLLWNHWFVSASFWCLPTCHPSDSVIPTQPTQHRHGSDISKANWHWVYLTCLCLWKKEATFSELPSQSHVFLLWMTIPASSRDQKSFQKSILKPVCAHACACACACVCMCDFSVSMLIFCNRGSASQSLSCHSQCLAHGEDWMHNYWMKEGRKKKERKK